MPPLIKKIILCSFAILWTPIACEAYLRLFFPVDIMPGSLKRGSMGFGETYPANATFTAPRNIGSTSASMSRVSVIRESSRGPSRTTSFVSFCSEIPSRWVTEFRTRIPVPARLETELAVLLKRPVEVVNLGVSGFGTAEELIVLEKEGWSYEPDLVMAHWHPSDPLGRRSFPAVRAFPARI